MSENNNTNSEEILNEENKVTVRININETDAADILKQFNAAFPAIDDLDEIHLIIRRDQGFDWTDFQTANPAMDMANLLRKAHGENLTAHEVAEIIVKMFPGSDIEKLKKAISQS